MDYRKQIIDLLSVKPKYEDGENFRLLFRCLDINGAAAADVETRNKFYSWFEGCINSLYYKSNKECLILSGTQGIGKTEFFRRLLPGEISGMFTDCEVGNFVYDKFLCCIDDFSIGKSTKRKVADICQKWLEDNIKNLVAPSVDFRLASYCGTSNVIGCDTRSSVMFHNIYLNSINQELYNSIDKLELWREIFDIYKRPELHY